MATYLVSPFSMVRVGLARASSSRPVSTVHTSKMGVQPKTSTSCASPASMTLQAHTGFTTHEVDSLSTVFSDESKGIVCYRSESGDVTCEGIDEGPHFQPPAAAPQPRVVSSSVYLQDFGAAGVLPLLAEETRYICMKEYKGGVFCEGKDES